MMLLGSLIVNNQAIGGRAGPDGTDGQGLGGGVYITAFSMVSADADTLITGNHASTSNDDVYGDFGSPAPHVGSRWALAVTNALSTADCEGDFWHDGTGP
jgi:hypothetical protein